MSIEPENIHPDFDISIFCDYSAQDQIVSLRADMAQQFGWSGLITFDTDKKLYDPADFDVIEGICRGRFVIFVISSGRIKSHGDGFDSFLLNLLSISFIYRPTLLLDQSGILKGITHLSPFVVEARGRGHAEILEALSNRFRDVITEDHLIQQKKHFLEKKLASSVENIFGSRPTVLVFGPAQPKDPLSTDINARLWWIRSRLCNQPYRKSFIGITGEDLEPIGSSLIEIRLNPAIKEKLFAREIQLIVVLCNSPGAIAELAIISQYNELACKTIIAMESSHKDGFVAKGPLKEAQNFGAQAMFYKPDELLNGDLETRLENLILERIEAEITCRLRAPSGS